MQIENNTRIPLPNFISREELRLDKELEYKNLLDIKWKQEGALPNIEVDLELMHQLLQHLIYWELNARNRSTSIEISCWKQTDRIWFRIGGSEEMPGPAESTVAGSYPIEDIGRMEQSEIHLAFAKTFARELKSHLWTWHDENDGPIVAFYVPAS
jgi:K+-sensing histidine kinase KdpD